MRTLIVSQEGEDMRMVRAGLLGVLVLVLLSACGRYQDTPLCDEYFASGDMGSFDVSADGLALDRATGLTWYRCNVGERFRDGQCVGQPQLSTRDDALAYVADINRASGRTWRLPTRDEFQTILTSACINPALNRQVFPSATSDSYWNAEDSRHGDYMGCTTNTYNGYAFCREMASNRRPFMMVSSGKQP